jgi:hypothetical protein
MPDLQLSSVAPVAGAVSTPLPAVPTAVVAPGASSAAPATAPVQSQPAAVVALSGAGVTAAKTPPPPVPDAPGKDAANAAAKGSNAATTASGTLLVFVFDDQAHHMAVKVLDVQTQKVVEQIPLQHMPATSGALAGAAPSGRLVDTRV